MLPKGGNYLAGRSPSDRRIMDKGSGAYVLSPSAHGLADDYRGVPYGLALATSLGSNLADDPVRPRADTRRISEVFFLAAPSRRRRSRMGA